MKRYLKNILLKFMKLILFFRSTTKKIQANENGREYILFRIDVYFSECVLAVEIHEKGSY